MTAHATRWLGSIGPAVLGFSFVAIAGPDRLHLLYAAGLTLMAIFTIWTMPDGLVLERAKLRRGALVLGLGSSRALGFVILTQTVYGAYGAKMGWWPVPPWVTLLGLVGFWAGAALHFGTMLWNPFFSKYIRIQYGRGHELIVDGPYSFVRHPGYTGLALALLSSPFAMGSLVALPLCWFGFTVLLVRTQEEDNFLRRYMTGYVLYSHEVKRKMIPGVW